MLLWLAAVSRLNALRQAATFTNGALAAAVCSVALACTFKMSARADGSETGPSISGDLPEHSLLVIAAVSAQLLLLSLKTGCPPRREIISGIAAAAGVLLVMVTAHRLAADSAADVAYRLTFHGYLSYALVGNIRLCLRYARAFDDLGRTLNLAFAGWGSAVALVYSASRLLYILVDLTLASRPTAIHTAGSVAALVGVSGIALGVLAPRAVRVLERWDAAIRGTRRIHPLWRDLTAAYPEIALPTSPPTTLRRAELRYHRRLLEIAEGLARAHVADPERDAPDAIGRVARALYNSRAAWTRACLVDLGGRVR